MLDSALVTVTFTTVNDHWPEFIFDDTVSAKQQTYFGAIDLYAKEFTTILTVKV